MCAAAVSVVGIVERSFGGQAGELAERKRTTVGRDFIPVNGNRGLIATQSLCARRPDSSIQILGRIKKRRPSHHGRARMIGSEALAHIVRRSVVDMANAIDRY